MAKMPDLLFYNIARPSFFLFQNALLTGISVTSPPKMVERRVGEVSIISEDFMGSQKWEVGNAKATEQRKSDLRLLTSDFPPFALFVK